MHDSDSGSDWELVDERILAFELKSNLTLPQIDAITVPNDAIPDRKFVRDHLHLEKKYFPDKPIPEPKSTSNETISTGNLKIISIESRNPTIFLDDSVYIAEQEPLQKSVLVFEDDKTELSGTDPHLVTNRFICHEVHVTEKVQEPVKKLPKKS